jgi:hypothetical protein
MGYGQRAGEHGGAYCGKAQIVHGSPPDVIDFIQPLATT